jgi:hypothetical protein
MVIGVVLVTLLVLLLALFLYRRRKSKKTRNSEDPRSVLSKAELPPSYPQELPAEKPIPFIQRKELATLANTHELGPAEKLTPVVQQKEFGTQADKHEPETSPTAAELQCLVLDRDQTL